MDPLPLMFRDWKIAGFGQVVDTTTDTATEELRSMGKTSEHTEFPTFLKMDRFRMECAFFIDAMTLDAFDPNIFSLELARTTTETKPPREETSA